MKVLLVIPPSSLKERWGKFSTAVQTYLPLGLAYIAAYAEKDGHEVKAIDAVAMRSGFEEIENIIKDFSPDVVGQQTVFSNLDECYRVASIAKKINPKTSVVLGGDMLKMAIQTQPSEYKGFLSYEAKSLNWIRSSFILMKV